MSKLLSLLSVSAVALSVAGFAYAEDAPKKKGPELSMSGSVSQMFRLTSQKAQENSKDTNGDSTAFNSQYSTGHGIYSPGYLNYISFWAGTQTDSGTDYAANIEVSFLPKVQAQRAYVEIGMAAGLFQFGRTYSATYNNLIDGSSALSGTGGWNGIGTTPFYNDNASSTMVGKKLTYFSPDITQNSDGPSGTPPAKISYTSPAFNGLTLGYSFTPVGYNLATEDKNAIQNQYLNVNNLTLNYAYETTQFGLFVHGGAVFAKNDNKNFHNARAYSAGLKFTMGDFVAAVGAHQFGKGGTAKDGTNGNNGAMQDIGLGYTIADIKYGIGFGTWSARNGQDETGTDLGKARAQFFTVGASSEVAKGLTALIEFNQLTEKQSSVTPRSSVSQQELVIGTTISF